MAKPKEEDTVQLGVWVRRDLYEAVTSFRHNQHLDSKREAVEQLLELGLKHAPPPKPTSST